MYLSEFSLRILSRRVEMSAGNFLFTVFACFAKVDKQSTQARKYQRNSEDLQAQMDSLRLQINHLQNRCCATFSCK